MLSFRSYINSLLKKQSCRPFRQQPSLLTNLLLGYTFQGCCGLCIETCLSKGPSLRKAIIQMGNAHKTDDKREFVIGVSCCPFRQQLTACKYRYES